MTIWDALLSQKEIRRTLRIREGDPLEIFTDREGEVILKKYSPISELSQFAVEYADCASQILGNLIIISDTDHVIAVSGGPKKDFLDKRISKDLEKVIQDKTSRLIHEKESIVEVINEKDSLNEYSLKCWCSFFLVAMPLRFYHTIKG